MRNFVGGGAAGEHRFFVDDGATGGRFAMMLLIGQAGFEPLLARELAELRGGTVREHGPGWVLADWPALAADQPLASSRFGEMGFPHLTLLDPVEIRGASVNALAQRIAEHFLAQLRGERIEAPWPSRWAGPAELVGLGRRLSAVEAEFFALLRRKLSRVAKLATAEPVPPGAIGGGLFVWFADFDRAFVAREAIAHGPRRMADDPQAPSRSYLKVEEAYTVLGREPAAGESVCDLGAAPGGWSYSAAKRGARVVAVDNGALKGGALDHPLIEHRREDAFRFAPANGEPFDWLFCDMVEEPHHVLQDIVAPWLDRGRCRSLVVNLKFGRVDPVRLLAELQAPGSVFRRHGRRFLIRHLYHDREEFTVVGPLRPRAL